MMERKHIAPPKWPVKILRFFIKEYYLEELEGGMEEMFRDNLEAYSHQKARRIYVWETIKLVRPTLLKVPRVIQKFNTSMMNNNYKIAYRNMLKNKAFSVLNLAGLSLGLTASLLILFYVLFETSYDHFHKNAEEVYRVEVSIYRAGTLESESALTPPAVGASLLENFPEVKHSTRIAMNPGKTNIVLNDKSYREEKAYICDPKLLEIFDLDFIKGTPHQMLSAPREIAISEALTTKLFGPKWKTQTVLNHTLELSSEGLSGSFKIAGVFKNLPPNSHFKPEILASKSYLTALVGDMASDHNWDFKFFYTYVQLAPKSDPEILINKFNSHIATSRKEVLQPRNIKMNSTFNPSPIFI